VAIVVGVITGIVTIATIIYQAGRLSAKLDTIILRFSQHEQQDEDKFKEVFHRLNAHGESIARISPRPRSAGGY